MNITKERVVMSTKNGVIEKLLSPNFVLRFNDLKVCHLERGISQMTFHGFCIKDGFIYGNIIEPVETSFVSSGYIRNDSEISIYILSGNSWIQAWISGPTFDILKDIIDADRTGLENKKEVK